MMSKVRMSNKKIQYSLNDDGRFVIDNYSEAKAFSNFFPGIAGLIGIPMWVFYVNRGQCITSFGIESKDKAIMEFQPANKSYRQTSLQGFRTFIKVRNGSKETYWEPFQNNLMGTDFNKTQILSISSHDLILEEVNKDLGLKAVVHYFTLPQEPFSALVRQVRITNLGKKNCDIEMVDGMPAIVPYGLTDGLNKNISRTAEAWIKVRNVNKKAPFYQMNVEISDVPEVKHIHEGNFFFSFDPDNKSKGLLKPIVEASIIFDQALDFSAPGGFLNKEFKVPSVQQTSNRTPSAFSHNHFKLDPNKSGGLVSYIGYARDVEQLNKISSRVMSIDYVEHKKQENKKIIDDIKNYAFTESSSNEFNMYCGSTFLDNILRGGLPVSLKTSEGNVAFNVYSRKHGDLERDYNYFFVAPTFYSQGNGNYRDVNQNRRNDVWFNSDVGDHHLIGFLNLIQADGYNPLIVKGTLFAVEDEQKGKAIIKKCVETDDRKAVEDFIQKGFLPGNLLKFIDDKKIKLNIKPWDFLGQLLEVSQKQELADHGEGYWSDHWTYNTDLLESYLAHYPDRLSDLFSKKNEFVFYHDPHYVVPREERYTLTPNGVRQYKNVKKLIESDFIKENGSKLRTKEGHGLIYQTDIVCKLLCLIANKAATLDPGGIGIEMEADKPNWYDSLNGLPGRIGSSVSETFELKRLCEFLLMTLNKMNYEGHKTFNIFEELAIFITGLTPLLSIKLSDYEYWDKSNGVKERYRQQIRLGISGKENALELSSIVKFLELIVKKTAIAVSKALDDKGFLATYFYYDVVKYDMIKNSADLSCQHVWPLKFQKHALPLFLEGYVHALRVENDFDKARELYQSVRKSGLYDKKLKMYKVTADLSDESEDIGRTRVFPPGWLENESIWLHMEYKFFLELIRSRLYDEFYDNFRNAFVPFLKPEVYGRNILENSSFIVSSAHEDKSLHGQGFVARLSGSTAEFMHIWLYMNVGKRPFRLNSEGKLDLVLKPALAGWLFTKKEKTYSFNFLGNIKVVYHNPKGRNTYGKNKAKIGQIKLTYDGNKDGVLINSGVIPEPFSHDVRNRKVERLDVYFD